LAPAYLADNLANPSIAFPLRLQQGLLQKTDEREAYLTLLGIMARTPRGSWAGHPAFGFHAFFSDVAQESLSEESRTRIAEKTAKEINSVLADLGLTHYLVDLLVLDPLERDTQGGDHTRWTRRMMQKRGTTLLLRESGSDRSAGYAL
jgi:hypothetical protein